MNITIDPPIPGALGSFGYDDEGTPAAARDGVPVGLTTDRRTAAHAPVHPVLSGGPRPRSGHRRVGRRCAPARLGGSMGYIRVAVPALRLAAWNITGNAAG
jgi:hypothetical protein